MLDVAGFDYSDSENVRDEALSGVNVAEKLNNTLQGMTLTLPSAATQGLQRVADVPIYSADAVARRSAPLQATHDAATPRAALHSAELQKLGLQSGDEAKLTQGEGSALLQVTADDSLPLGVVRVAASHAATAQLGAMFGTITVEAASGSQA